ncbi:MAG TPA: hypothetical protein VJ945_05195, partial [Flavobacteriaceae bacterium]|nr:hypothetical protein [Flavobacteriaceae bacterium]
MQIVSSSNTSITVKAMSSLTQGSGYIKAILQYQNLQKDVWVGKFLPLDLRLRDPSTNNPVYFICYLQSTTVKATHDSGTVPDSWQWSVSGASVTYPYSSNNS